MEMRAFTMEIIDADHSNYRIKISDDTENTLIEFDPSTKRMGYLHHDDLAGYLKDNEYQLRTMLHNKRRNTFYVGFKLVFVLRNNKDVAGFNDRGKIVVLDKRKNRYDSYVIDESEAQEKIHKVFTDASYQENSKCGAVAIIIQDLNDHYELFTERVQGTGSSQAELFAVIRALEILKDVDQVRIITDSQYIRKGLTEWIPYWKLNGFKTINGECVKSIEHWMKADHACDKKYIEFQWVKGHADHFENVMCDLYAKDAARCSTLADQSLK